MRLVALTMFLAVTFMGALGGIGVAGYGAVSCEGGVTKVGLNVIWANGEEQRLDITPIFISDRLLVPVRSTFEALGYKVQWEEGTDSVIVTKGGNTRLKLVVGSPKAYLNGKAIELGLPVQNMRGRVLVPLRAVAEALGMEVQWEGKNNLVLLKIPEELTVPQRVYYGDFPAKVAFTSNGHLWLVEGLEAGAKPMRITHEGIVQILGWSFDGQWLMYLHQAFEGAPWYLWVTRGDGTQAFKVDSKPVWGRPSWSPVANKIAFSTQEPGDNPDYNLKIATLAGDKVTVEILLPDKSRVIDYAWAPDGRSLAVSFPRDEQHPLHIERVFLSGERTNLLTLGSPVERAKEPIFLWVATGLKWSPNGRYLAYYLRFNSASLSSDGVPIEVLDLKQPAKPLVLGTGLPYQDWLVWSPDGNLLAYIAGTGREATVNKKLHIVDMSAGGKIINLGQEGQVDTNPVWTSMPIPTLLFCRGPEAYPWGKDILEGGLVPGQKIYCWSEGIGVRALTDGSANSSASVPMVSSNGRYLFYLRLTNYNRSSLWSKLLPAGSEVELVKGLVGTLGYYGNYLPPWVSIYSATKLAQFTGTLKISEVEGRHFELETREGRLVLIPQEGNETIKAFLEAKASQQVTVRGILLDGVNFYMRGPVLKVTEVESP
ncbi:Copper amine oxidase N-terminal domain-containing protein [Thermanaeromonas toyohensis ToBE]|uniref:Copper amine oxidase N-terminal domain-containing protein n=1 Tax=Thermanaeromonas toyohensis ToBE TaxID=698762 RepID=A0A1W1W1V1_9FIRM|nr:stalk domain-containing protein [Thermanaeromonas toyohensis]SMB99605.1 Copper amine oxidase N-terminal domain-containing protein [Thermanaeromonas toyohensis ToBE]